jgi:hypothetical protein
MSLTSINELDGTAKTWVFGASRAFGGDVATIRATMERFIDDWTAHGADLPAAFDLVEDQFLVVAADERAQPGGCAVDRLFDLMRAFERELGLPMLDSSLVFFRDTAGTVRSASRPEFRELAAAGEVSRDTVVFDTSIDSLSDFRNGRWAKPAFESWHGAAFGLT